MHHHLLFQSRVGIKPGSLDERDLKKFMLDLLDVLNMKCLIEPRVKLSHQHAWTGIVGIITSHIAFHYWVNEKYIQLDIYSCKKFDKKKTIDFLKSFWKSESGKAIFLDREIGKDFKIERLEV